ncbi:MAG: ribosome small subunit-dependent GTPase A [Lachnospiraceae bacterium]|nr:ribosome small subunit-dependent GTPase A [Lachnospiraceae bacterium]
MAEGVIVKGIGGFYYVNTDSGIYECRARGIFRKENITPTVGDKVVISILDERNKKGSLDKILERRNSLSRPKVSNVDQAVVVFSIKNPDINYDILDRFLILAETEGINPVVCINKTDIDEEGRHKAVCRLYEDAGYEVYAVSSLTGEGIKELKPALEGKISVFAGPSGVGKSSIINALNSDFSLKIGDLSEKIMRGRHTTRHTELMEVLKGCYIVDSPGFTSLDIGDIKKEELWQYFREFLPWGNKCRYTGCSHINEPDCAIKDQIGKTISKERYERYINIYNELAEERKK